MAWRAKYLLGPAVANVAFCTLPAASTATFTRTLMVPWIVSRADLDTAGIGCCTTWPEIVAGAWVGASAVAAGTGTAGWVAAELAFALALFVLARLVLPDLRAEGLIAADDGAASSFAGAFDRAEEVPEEVSAEGVAEFSDETEVG